MDSNTQTGSLPAIQNILATDDPAALELAQRLAGADDDSLVLAAGDARNFVAEARRRYEQMIAQDLLTIKVAEAILLHRILERGGRALPHDDYNVEVVASKTIDKRIDVLRQLEGKVPDGELRKALYLTNPQPEWKADARQLGVLARKYGPESEIGKIIAAGLVESYGPPRLVIEPREQTKNVTPIEGAA